MKSPSHIPSEEESLCISPVLEEDAAAAAALDHLLGQASVPVLSAGFANGVIQAVGAESQFPLGGSHSVQTTAPSLSSAGSRGPWIRILAVAAVLALAATLGWRTALQQKQDPLAHLVKVPHTAEEELFLSALSSLELTGSDFAVVAQLGDVLEAELAERQARKDWE